MPPEARIPRRRYRRNDEENDNPLQPLNGSVGAGAVARSQGYSSPELDMNGNLKSVMGPDGQRVATPGGMPPQDAANEAARAQALQGPPSFRQSPQAPNRPAAAPGGSVQNNVVVQDGGNGTTGGGSTPPSQPRPRTNALDGRATAGNYLDTRPSVQDRLDSLPNGGPSSQSVSAAPMYQMPTRIAAGPGVSPSGGLSHEEAMLLLNARRANPERPGQPPQYGKTFQTSAPQTVGAGETAFLNGKPVAPGNAVTFVGPGAGGAVVSAAPTYSLPGTAPQAPAAPAMPKPLAPDTLAKQTPAAPMFSLSTGAPAPARPVGFQAPTNNTAATSAPAAPLSPALEPGLEAGQKARAAVGNFVQGVGNKVGGAIDATAGAVRSSVNTVRGFLGETTPLPTAKELGFDGKPPEYDFLASTAAKSPDGNAERVAPSSLGSTSRTTAATASPPTGAGPTYSLPSLAKQGTYGNALQGVAGGGDKSLNAPSPLRPDAVAGKGPVTTPPVSTNGSYSFFNAPTPAAAAPASAPMLDPDEELRKRRGGSPMYRLLGTMVA